MKFPLIRTMAVGMLALAPIVSTAQDAPPDQSNYGSKDAEADAAKTLIVDEVPGYGGVKFGATLPDSGFTLEQDRGKVKIYVKKGETLLMGPALLETVLYYVLDGKLYAVAFHTNDGQDSLALKSVFINGFGQGEDSKDGSPTTVWIGKKNGLIFDLNTSTGDGSAFLFDHKLHDLYLADQSDTAKAAAQKLIQGK